MACTALVRPRRSYAASSPRGGAVLLAAIPRRLADGDAIGCLRTRILKATSDVGRGCRQPWYLAAVACDNRAGPDHCIIANVYSRKNDGAAAYPNILSDRYGTAE